MGFTWHRDAPGHYRVGDGQRRIDFNTDTGKWEMRLRGQHIGNADTLTKGQKWMDERTDDRIDTYVEDMRRPPLSGNHDSSTGTTNPLRSDITDGNVYAVELEQGMSLTLRKAVIKSLNELDGFPSSASTYAHDRGHWTVTFDHGSEWPVTYLRELEYNHCVTVRWLQKVTVAANRAQAHTEGTDPPPTERQDRHVSQTTASHRKTTPGKPGDQPPQPDAGSTDGHGLTLVHDVPRIDQEAGQAAPVQDEWEALPEPKASPEAKVPPSTRVDAVKEIPAPIRKRIEASFAANVAIAAAHPGTSGGRKRIPYVWDIQPCTSEDQAKRFAEKIERYAKYRPLGDDVPFKADGVPRGQITVRHGAPTQYYDTDNGPEVYTGGEGQTPYWGMRYSARQFEQRNSGRRLPGSASE